MRASFFLLATAIACVAASPVQLAARSSNETIVSSSTVSVLTSIISTLPTLTTVRVPEGTVSTSTLVGTVTASAPPRPSATNIWYGNGTVGSTGPTIIATGTGAASTGNPTSKPIGAPGSQPSFIPSSGAGKLISGMGGVAAAVAFSLLF